VWGDDGPVDASGGAGLCGFCWEGGTPYGAEGAGALGGVGNDGTPGVGALWGTGGADIPGAGIVDAAEPPASTD